MSGYMPTPGQLRSQARDHRHWAKNAKQPARRAAHLQIAATLEHEARAIELDQAARQRAALLRSAAA